MHVKLSPSEALPSGSNEDPYPPVKGTEPLPLHRYKYWLDIAWAALLSGGVTTHLNEWTLMGQRSCPTQNHSKSPSLRQSSCESGQTCVCGNASKNKFLIYILFTIITRLTYPANPEFSWEHNWCRPSSWAIFLTCCQTLQLSKRGSGFPGYVWNYVCQKPTCLKDCLKIRHFRVIVTGKGPVSHRRSFIQVSGTPPQDGGIVRIRITIRIRFIGQVCVNKQGIWVWLTLALKVQRLTYCLN